MTREIFGQEYGTLTDLWNNFTGKTSKDIAEKNYNLQREQFDYQKQLNDLMMEREDTAYQRAVKDAQAAGLSASSVSGGAAAAGASSAPAPQINDYAQDKFMHGMNLVNAITQFQNNITQQSIARSKAEADINKTNAETASILANNELFNYELAGRKKLFDADTADRLRNYDFNNKFNIFNGADPYEKFAILNKLDSSRFSDIIQTNQFNKIGLLYNLLATLGGFATGGKISSIDSALNAINEKFPQIFKVNNNSLDTSVIDFGKLMSLPQLFNDKSPNNRNDVFDWKHPIKSIKGYFARKRKANSW